MYLGECLVVSALNRKVEVRFHFPAFDRWYVLPLNQFLGRFIAYSIVGRVGVVGGNHAFINDCGSNTIPGKLAFVPRYA